MFQEKLNELNNLEPVRYFNGKDYDYLNLGQLLNQYIYNNSGSRAYQEFQNLLNDILTSTGCNHLLLLKEDGSFYKTPK